MLLLVVHASILCEFYIVTLLKESLGFVGIPATGLACFLSSILLLMDKILHDPKDPRLWELWYIPYNG